jgi:hypothetical protein
MQEAGFEPSGLSEQAIKVYASGSAVTGTGVNVVLLHKSYFNTVGNIYCTKHPAAW